MPTVDEIAAHKRLLRRIPQQHSEAFVQLCSKAFADYAKSRDGTDQQLVALTNLLSIPAVCLVQARGGRNNRNAEARNTQSVNWLMSEVMRTANSSLWDESASLLNHIHFNFPWTQSKSFKSIQDTGISSNTVQQALLQEQLKHAQQAAKARAAVAHMRSGYVQRAARSLTQNDSAVNPSSDADIALMSELHPRCPSALPCLPLSSTDCVNMIDSATVQHVLKKICNGSAPGLSGWTAEHLRVLINDTSCMSGLAKLVSDIVNNRLSTRARSYIIATKLIGITKKGDRQKLRPIAIGETFYRLAAAIAYQKCGSVIAEKLKAGLVQYGLAQTGCQRVHTSVHAMLRNAAVPKAALMFDFANAFNCINRAHVMRTVYTDKDLCSLHKMIQFAYGSDTPLYSRDDTTGRYRQVLTSSNGVRQGDPLASALFCLSVQCVYDEVKQCVADMQKPLPYDNHADTIKAIHDDLVVMVDLRVESIKRVMNCARDAAARVGLRVQPAKCKLVWMHGDACASDSDRAAVQAYCVEQHLMLTDNCLLLGAPLAAADADTSALCHSIVDSHNSFFDIVASDAMPVQEAMNVLRIAAAPKLDYVSQLVAPHLMQTAAAKFDASVQRTTIKKLELQHVMRDDTTTALVHQQLAMPTKNGGFGIRRISDTAPVAYYSTHVTCCALDSAFWDHVHIDVASSALSDFSEQRPVARNLALASQQLIRSTTSNNTHSGSRSAATLIARRVTDADSRSFFVMARKMQAQAIFSHRHALQHQVDECTKQQFEVSTVAHDHKYGKARLMCVTAPHAADWMRAAASSSHSVIPDGAWRLAARLRLGLPEDDTHAAETQSMAGSIAAVQQQPQTEVRLCVCGVDMRAADADMHHWMTCGSNGNERTARHDCIKNVLKAHCNVALLTCAVKPEFAHASRDGGALRPDLLIDLSNSRTVMVDVTVSHPLRQTFFERASTRPLASCEDAARKKKEKYANLSARFASDFVGFACETTGGLSQGAVRLLSDIVLSAAELGASRTKGQLRNELFGSVAAAIVVGNFKMHRYMRQRTILKAANGLTSVHNAPMHRGALQRADRRVQPNLVRPTGVRAANPRSRPSRATSAAVSRRPSASAVVFDPSAVAAPLVASAQASGAEARLRLLDVPNSVSQSQSANTQVQFQNTQSHMQTNESVLDVDCVNVL